MICMSEDVAPSCTILARMFVSDYADILKCGFKYFRYLAKAAGLQSSMTKHTDSILSS